jgi:hypothetical protein
MRRRREALIRAGVIGPDPSPVRAEPDRGKVP